MKKFFLSIKNWFARHWPTKRRLIQIYTALLYNANVRGFISGTISQSESKYLCVPGMNCYSCPGAIGSCPLGSLQNAFYQSGTRAGFYIIGILGLFGLIFARTVCGFLCPVGLGQELLHKIPSPKIKKGRATRALSYLKYVILVVLVLAVPILYGLQGIAVPAFCKYICPAGTFGGGLGLLSNPANWSGSRDFLNMLGPIFTWKFALLCAIVVLCVFMYRPFCRFLCPLGAIYGFFNRIAFLGVKVDKLKCTDCGLCVKECDMDVKHVGDHECIHCGKCIKVCPVQAISWKGAGLFKKKDADDAQPEAEQTEEATPDTQAMQSCSAEKCKHCPSACKTKAESTQTAELAESVVEVEIGSPAPAPVPGRALAFAADAGFASGSASYGSPPSAAPPAEQPKRKRSKSFWMKASAVGMALLLLTGAVVYSNVFAKQLDVLDMQIGTECPDFTLQKYGESSSGYRLLDETFTLSEQHGSVVVINFWATWCGPCVEELPHFNQIATEFPEVKIVAIHADKSDGVARYIIGATDDEGTKWRDYNLIFLQDEIVDNVSMTYQALGGNSALPVTLIVNGDGKITYTKQGSLSYEKLKTEVEKAHDPNSMGH